MGLKLQMWKLVSKARDRISYAACISWFKLRAIICKGLYVVGYEWLIIIVTCNSKREKWFAVDLEEWQNKLKTSINCVLDSFFFSWNHCEHVVQIVSISKEFGPFTVSLYVVGLHFGLVRTLFLTMPVFSTDMSW